jgi:hypothetical protein
MWRGIHIAISLMAVVLLLRPLDCFAAGTPSRQANDCCLKGKCVPTATSDECCKNTVPDNNQLAPSKAGEHSSPLIALTVVHIGTLLPPAFLAGGDPVPHPPPGTRLTSPSLPLLI